MPQLDSEQTIWKKIKALDLPRKTKAMLRTWWRDSKALVQSIVEFLYNKRVFCTYVLLGAILYYFLGALPYVGPMLATMGLSFSMLAGIVKQIEADLRSHFTVFSASPA